MEVQSLFKPNEEITLQGYLNKMGIDDIDKYLYPSEQVLDNCYIYDNIQECTQTIKYHILNDDRIAIVIDSDMDGSCSAYMMYKYLKLQHVSKVRPFIQEGKNRGIASSNLRKQILDWKPNLVIIPDAGTNSRLYEDEIIDNGIDLVIIDHHAQDEGVCKRAIIVNNTMNRVECNRKLSGTGVTFKVLQALDDSLNTHYSDRFIDLVGISIISDSMDVRTYENRWFVDYILEDVDNVTNKFLYTLFKKLLLSDKKTTYTQRDISFRVVPLFNSVIRSGTLEEKQQLFMAMCGKNIEETMKMCQHYHAEQIKKVDKFIEHHQEEIDAQANSNITIIDATDVPQAFSGLIAGRISGNTNKPCIVGKTINGELGGSFRGNIPRKIMETLPHINKAAGHPNGAYGIFVDTSKSQNLDDLRVEIDKMDISTIPTVTASFSANNVQMNIFNEFFNHDDLWGKELDKPKFYIYNIRVNNKNIKLMGKKQDTIKLVMDNYEIMFFKLSKEQKEKFGFYEQDDGTYKTKAKELQINLIGSVNINTQYGNTNQIFVEDFEIEEYKNTFEDLL